MTVAAPPRAAAGWFLAWSIALAPLPLIAAGWGHDLSPAQSFARSYALPIIAVELTVAIVALLETRRLPPVPRPAAVLLLLLVAIAFFSAAHAPDRVTSLFMTLIWLNHLLFGFGVYLLVRHRRLAAPPIIRAMPLAFLLFATLLVGYYALHSAHGHDWYYDSPPFNNIRWLGYYCAAIVGLSAWGWLENRTSWLAVAILALALALWTGSRGSLIAVLAGYLAARPFVPAAVRGSMPRFLGAVLLAVLLALVASRIAPFGGGSAERLLLDHGDSGRIEIWGRTIAMIAQRPWSGWGEAQFGTLFQSRFAQPHNSLLQIMLAWGVAGLALVAVLATMLAKRLRRNIRPQNAPLMFAIANLAAFSLIDGSLFHVQSVSTFALCLGLLAADDGDEGGDTGAGADSGPTAPPRSRSALPE